MNLKNKIITFKINNFNKSYLYNIAATLCVHHYLNHNINFLKNNFNNFKIPEGRGNEKNIKIKNKKTIPEIKRLDIYLLQLFTSLLHSNSKSTHFCDPESL